MSAAEQPFGAARAWLAAEQEGGEAGFTRVVIGDLKPDVLAQIIRDDKGTHICQVHRCCCASAWRAGAAAGCSGRHAGCVVWGLAAGRTECVVVCVALVGGVWAGWLAATAWKECRGIRCAAGKEHDVLICVHR